MDGDPGPEHLDLVPANEPILPRGPVGLIQRGLALAAEVFPQDSAWWRFEEVGRFHGHQAEICGVGFAPDGRTGLSADRRGTVILHDIGTGREIRRHELGRDALWDSESTGAVLKVAFSGDAKLAALIVRSWPRMEPMPTTNTGYSRRFLGVFDIETGDELANLPEEGLGWFYGVAFAPDNRILCTLHPSELIGGGLGNRLYTWQYRGFGSSDFAVRPLREYKTRAEVGLGLSCTPDGSLALICHWGDSVHISIVDLTTGDEALIWEVNAWFKATAMPFKDGLPFLPRHVSCWHGNHFGLCVGLDAGAYRTANMEKGNTNEVGTIAVLDLRTGRILHSMGNLGHGLDCVALSADGCSALVGSRDGTVYLWGVPDFSRASQGSDLLG